MTLRLTLAVLLVSATPALAQRGPRPSAPVAATDTFEKDLDALFSSGGLTSDQAATRARTASPVVRRRVAEIEVAVAQAEIAELSRVPQLGGKLSYTRLSPIDPVVFPIGAMNFVIPSLQNSYLAEATLNVALSDYVLRYPKLIDAARLGAEAARTTKRQSEVSASEDARLAYYEWVRSKLQVLIAKRQLTQVTATLGQVKALAEVQRLSKADLLRVESQEAVAEQTLDQLQNLANLREEQLRILIGAPASEPLSIGEDIRRDIAPPGAAGLDELVGTAKNQRLDFRTLDVGIQAKDKQRSAETAGLLPRLSAFAVGDYANPNPRVFPQADKYKFTWALGAQITWTLNDALTAHVNDRRIAGETNELRADRENLERGVRIELLSSQQAVSLAQHALTTSQKGLTAAEEGYRVRRELLNAERATAVELVDAETDLTRARITALNARVDLRVAMTQLAHALGSDAK